MHNLFLQLIHGGLTIQIKSVQCFAGRLFSSTRPEVMCCRSLQLLKKAENKQPYNPVSYNSPAEKDK